MLLIGFGHKARQGKNTAAIVMLNEAAVDCRARLYAYADALRAEAKAAIREAGGLAELIKRGYKFRHIASGPDGLRDVYEPFPSWVIAEEGKPRTLLQWWGTDYRRAQDTNYWVDRLMETLKRESPDMALITDVRFPNEVEALHAAGGYVVKVIKTTPPDIKVPAHPSENELDGCTDWDFEIKAANMAELRKQAAAIYHKIARKHGKS